VLTTLLVALAQKGKVAKVLLDADPQIVAGQHVQETEMSIEKSRRSPYHAKKSQE
jgi:hypothetical protein